MDRESIPFVELKNEFSARVADRAIERIRAIFQNSDFILGSALEEFEHRFAKLCGCRFAIGVNSGLDALVLTLRAIEVGPGDEVITVPNSFVASVAAIHLAGARPIFVDVRDDYNMDPDKLESAITPRTKAILPVHLTGNPCNMQQIMGVAERFRLIVIEDAAQAVGATFQGRPVGGFGIAGCFSLHPLKNLHVWGDGGVITTSDESLAARLRRARNHGLRTRDECEFFSHNSRLDTIQAAVALEGLSDLADVAHRRRENARFYDSELKQCVQIPLVDWARANPVYHVYQIRTERRDALAQHLVKYGIGTKVHYPIPLHLQPAAAYLGYKRGDFPVTERLANAILSIPVRENLTNSEVLYIAKSIRDFFGNQQTID